MEHCIARGCPFGEEKWQQRIARNLGLIQRSAPAAGPDSKAEEVAALFIAALKK
jgi:hypothetical protein